MKPSEKNTTEVVFGTGVEFEVQIYVGPVTEESKPRAMKLISKIKSALDDAGVSQGERIRYLLVDPEA